MNTAVNLATQIAERLLVRNEIIEDFFSQQARELGRGLPRDVRALSCAAAACSRSAAAPTATDAQHVSVEFVHPVIVGKRALPALDLSLLMRPWLDAILRPDDIVMGFGPPEGDPEVWAALDSAHSRGAMTFALPGPAGSYALQTAIRRSVHSPGTGRNFLPHAVGDGACLSRASRTRPGRGQSPNFFIPFLGQQDRKRRLSSAM